VRGCTPSHRERRASCMLKALTPLWRSDVIHPSPTKAVSLKLAALRRRRGGSVPRERDARTPCLNIHGVLT
jgi:hypothetical protein